MRFSPASASTWPQRVMQLQREVGVLGGVVAGLVDRDLVEADLLGALAAQVFV